jgi:hypothetical protein
MDYCPRDATPLPPPLNATQFNISADLSQRYRILRRIGEGGMGTVFLAGQQMLGTLRRGCGTRRPEIACLIACIVKMNEPVVQFTITEAAKRTHSFHRKRLLP